MLRLFRSTRNVNGPTALCEKAPHPQLPSAFGETVSCSDKPGLGQESCAQLRVTSNTTAIFHATSNTSGHSSDEDVDSNPGSSLHRATSDPNTPEGAESPHTPPIQCYTQPRDASDQDAATPLNASESTFPAVDLPVTQHDPNNSAHILKLLRRDTGGGATCLWQLDRGECGFSSQVDLVKRHIKRVHYRLRPHGCQHCGRKFFNTYTLSLHINTHTGRKPYACNLCGKGFSTPSGKSHHRAHRHRWRAGGDDHC